MNEFFEQAKAPRCEQSQEWRHQACAVRAVFITVSSDGVVMRDSWEETAKTGHWRA